MLIKTKQNKLMWIFQKTLFKRHGIIRKKMKNKYYHDYFSYRKILKDVSNTFYRLFERYFFVCLFFIELNSNEILLIPHIQTFILFEKNLLINRNKVL